MCLAGCLLCPTDLGSGGFCEVDPALVLLPTSQLSAMKRDAPGEAKSKVRRKQLIVSCRRGVISVRSFYCPRAEGAGGSCSHGALISSVTCTSNLEMDPGRSIPIWSLCFSFCCLPPWCSQHSLEHLCRQRGGQLGYRDGGEVETRQREFWQS